MIARTLARSAYRAIPFKRQLFELVRGRVSLPPQIYQHLHFVGAFSIDLGSGCSFQIHGGGAFVENELFWSGYGGTWERTSLLVWAELCRNRSGLILDVGANTGVYSLAAAALAPAAEIIAFEPVERMAEQLAGNVALNRFRIRIEQAAVSDHSGIVPIYDIMSGHNYSASLEGQGPDAEMYEVPATSVDDWLDRNDKGAINAIKIDIERHEPAAFRGMQRLFARQRPPMVVEILDHSIGGQIEQIIDGLDYRMFHIDEDRGLIPTKRLRPLRDHHWNHLLCREDDFRERNLERLVA
jgi:FkbM family methyltransferase